MNVGRVRRVNVCVWRHSANEAMAVTPALATSFSVLVIVSTDMSVNITWFT